VTDDRGSIYFRGTRTIEVTRDVRWIDRITFYAEHGDWFVAVAAALAFLGFAALRLRD
jgi:apolipoprotein N-acyltransferase